VDAKKGSEQESDEVPDWRGFRYLINPIRIRQFVPVGICGSNCLR